ncbi:MAG: type II restriction endonuclease [Sphaerochaetaceae bacterium]
MSRDFDKWLKGFKESISGYQYYVDFEKVVNNVDQIKIELNILNSLIGSTDIENEFEAIISRYPETLKCIPILLAVRYQELYAQDPDGAFLYNFKEQNQTISQYKIFMRKTGLFDMLSKHLVNNLVDYVLGVETGLDSNGRKNRGGKQMETLVENYLIEAGLVSNENYFKEMTTSDIKETFNVDIALLSNQGKSIKRFDFVVYTGSEVYAIETNFYTSGGSKLNETARSYLMLGKSSVEIDGFNFMWITDGKGWISARENLREAFDQLKYVFNIKDMEDGILRQLFKK